MKGGNFFAGDGIHGVEVCVADAVSFEWIQTTGELINQQRTRIDRRAANGK